MDEAGVSQAPAGLPSPCLFLCLSFPFPGCPFAFASFLHLAHITLGGQEQSVRGCRGML